MCVWSIHELRRAVIGLLPWRRRNPRRARRFSGRRTAGLETAAEAYHRSVKWGDRLTRYANEPVDVPPYEVGALKGERPPHRLRWRGRWYRLGGETASWKDGRKPVRGRPEYGRLYFLVETERNGFFQIYFERSDKRRGTGKWVLYRRTQLRPA